MSPFNIALLWTVLSRKRNSRLLSTVGLLLSLAQAVFPASYVLVPKPSEGGVYIEVHIEKPSKEFRMPAWAPGDYRIVNFGKRLRNVSFTLDGGSVSYERSDDPNLWKLPNGADKVSYFVPSTGPSLFTEDIRVNSQEMYIEGPAVFGYFQGHQEERQTLKVRLLSVNASIETALEKMDSDSEGWGGFSAPNYETLVDSPIVMGTKIRVKTFMVAGKEHRIVGFNNPQSVDLEEYARVSQRIVEAVYDLFGELPYKRYLFLFDFGGSGGGLEHANCARLAIPSGTRAIHVASFIAHEYFHAFNVKRIRPKVLGPFDYTKPAITGTLWWMEGVTDYYAEVLITRAGLQTRKDFLEDMSYTIQALESTPASMRVSADESSRRVWEANNSSGYGLDYYLKGKAIGLLFDISIRGYTKGERSLDDVLLALYKETKNGKPGFEENRIKELCVMFGGKEMESLYDRAVLKPGKLPFSEVAPLIGMKWESGALFDDPRAEPEKRNLGKMFPYSKK
ncbi:MAG TPA: hypothetical protein VNK96_00225 [Fimbriimonadales bacterium]|nr:hypothetical protein [Fimbriimonadales bacterium]